MTLRDCEPGRDVTVRALHTDERRRARLVEWGFVTGARVRLVARGSGGGLIVAVDDARVALDAALAASLVVEPLS